MLFSVQKVIGLIKNKFSKFVIKKALKIMSNNDIDYVIDLIEEKRQEANPKDFKKLTNLIEKLKAVKSGKEFEIN